MRIYSSSTVLEPLPKSGDPRCLQRLPQRGKLIREKLGLVFEGTQEKYATFWPRAAQGILVFLPCSIY